MQFLNSTQYFNIHSIYNLRKIYILKRENLKRKKLKNLKRKNIYFKKKKHQMYTNETNLSFSFRFVESRNTLRTIDIVYYHLFLLGKKCIILSELLQRKFKYMNGKITVLFRNRLKTVKVCCTFRNMFLENFIIFKISM